MTRRDLPILALQGACVGWCIGCLLYVVLSILTEKHTTVVLLARPDDLGQPADRETDD